MSRTHKFSDPEGLYYITFATVAWIDVFTRMQYKNILIENLNFCRKEKGLELFGYVIMTNHVHLIARARNGFEISAIIRDFKKYTSKQVLKVIEENPQESRKECLPAEASAQAGMLQIFRKAGKNNSNNKKYQFWQQDNHPIELYTNEVINQKLEYIHKNPVVEGIVKNEEDYLYSSARNYSNLECVMKIDLELN